MKRVDNAFQRINLIVIHSKYFAAYVSIFGIYFSGLGSNESPVVKHLD